jgi:hypothetical protein
MKRFRAHIGQDWRTFLFISNFNTIIQTPSQSLATACSCSPLQGASQGSIQRQQFCTVQEFIYPADREMKL